MQLYDPPAQTFYFRDRQHAGLELAQVLKEHIKENAYILALPRGGVPVAYEIAKAFDIPFSVIVTRKISAPQNPEYGIGAISEGGVTYVNDQTINLLGLGSEDLEPIIKMEHHELQRQIEQYRQGEPLPLLTGKQIIIIDDGLATGATAKASIETVKKHNPQEIIFASPVCAESTSKEISQTTVHVVCVLVPDDLRAIGMYYQNFDQVSDEEVVNILRHILL